MSYIPTPEQMTALGFDNKFQLGPRVYLGRLVEAGYMKVVVPLFADGRTKFIVVDEDEESRKMLFDLPSKDFFEQLLAAVGFRFPSDYATPPPPPPGDSGQMPGAADGAGEA